MNELKKPSQITTENFLKKLTPPEQREVICRYIRDVVIGDNSDDVKMPSEPIERNNLEQQITEHKLREFVIAFIGCSIFGSSGDFYDIEFLEECFHNYVRQKLFTNVWS